MVQTEWNIRQRSETCQETGRALVDGETFYTLLFEGAEGLERMDLCEEAWQGRAEDAPKPVCFWKSAFKEAPPRPPEPLRKEDAESELRRLMESGDPTHHKACFLLALLLERKRILKARERTEVNGVRTVVYEHTGTQETFLIPQIEIHLDEVAGLQEELKSGDVPIFAMARRMEAESPNAPTASGDPEPSA